MTNAASERRTLPGRIWPHGSRDELSKTCVCKQRRTVKLRTQSSWDVPLTADEMKDAA